MEKILADIEDFQLVREPKVHNCSDEIINTILNELYTFTIENSKNNNSDILRKDFIELFHKQCRIHKVAVKKSDLILKYRKYLENGTYSQNILLEKLLCKKPSRSISGITSITLIMSPFPHGQTFSCKHNCYYCPNEPAHKGNKWQAQPRSYLYHEPAVRRANDNDFKAYEQMMDRMNTLYMNGHTIDKLKIIDEGGTYTQYPEKYCQEFHRDTYYAANTFFDKEKRAVKTLEEEVYLNRNAKVHIIGICIETRPDALDDAWIRHFRKCGVTRIQLGVQSTHNHILKKINRGHNIECAVEAIELLKNLCFKIDIHIMPDLPYSTPELDKKMFDYVYSTLRPDQMKIYPCSVVPWTIIEKWFNRGEWKPYEPEVLLDVMNYAMKECPDWIRLPRVIRDIPGLYIQAGNSITNLRQYLVKSREIRSREIERHPEYYSRDAKIFVEKYSELDYFISYESLDKKALFGFIRLRLPKNNNQNIFKVLNKKALIRELHVYGFNTAVGHSAKASQHRGIGTKLLKKAESISFWNGYCGTAVISGEGVKEYYKKLGYYEKDTYMIKEFKLVKIIIFIISYFFFNSILNLFKI